MKYAILNNVDKTLSTRVIDMPYARLVDLELVEITRALQKRIIDLGGTLLPGQYDANKTPFDVVSPGGLKGKRL